MKVLIAKDLDRKRGAAWLHRALGARPDRRGVRDLGEPSQNAQADQGFLRCVGDHRKPPFSPA